MTNWLAICAASLMMSLKPLNTLHREGAASNGITWRSYACHIPTQRDAFVSGIRARAQKKPTSIFNELQPFWRTSWISAFWWSVLTRDRRGSHWATTHCRAMARLFGSNFFLRCIPSPVKRYY